MRRLPQRQYLTPWLQILHYHGLDHIVSTWFRSLCVVLKYEQHYPRIRLYDRIG